ncbi:MAG: transporter [Rhodospirillaceae bacterium]|nr:transporter [Rhodospirillaceae bacterium]|tara:strand:+ start:163 stop:1110 length:948 start_codon:yes stop_codon:yes gene_type:complete
MRDIASKVACMYTVFSALLPIFCIIVIGAFLNVTNFFPRGVWEGLERLVYWVLLPSLLINKLGGTNLSQFDVVPMGSALAAAVLLIVASLAIIKFLCKINQTDYTSVLQGAIRQNSYIGLAAAGPLLGPEGEALAAVGIAAVIPLVNVISMWSLARISTGSAPSLTSTLKHLITSPIILACMIGISINISGYGVPFHLANLLDLVSKGALPLGLLAVGAGLNIRVVLDSPLLLLLSNALKLIAAPIIVSVLCNLLQVDPVAKGIAVLFAALPTSASSYVMSRQFNGNHKLMAAILTSQVLMAALTIPLIALTFLR